jgi:hypothetical protein
MNKNLVYLGIVVAVIVVGYALYRNMGGVNMNVALEQNTGTSTEEILATTTATTSATSTANGVPTNNPNSGKVPSGYPASWPSDVPKYPNGSVKYTGGNNPQSGPVEATVVLSTKDSVRTVVDFYLKQLVVNGWKITENGNGTVNMTTFRAVKGKRSVGGYAVREANGLTTTTVGVNTGL